MFFSNVIVLIPYFQPFLDKKGEFAVSFQRPSTIREAHWKLTSRSQLLSPKQWIYTYECGCLSLSLSLFSFCSSYSGNSARGFSNPPLWVPQRPCFLLLCLQYKKALGPKDPWVGGGDWIGREKSIVHFSLRSLFSQRFQEIEVIFLLHNRTEEVGGWWAKEA